VIAASGRPPPDGFAMGEDLFCRRSQGEILLSKGRKFLDSVYKQKNTHAHTRKRPGMFPIKGVASTATSPDI
jgi:hypothetical protein